VNVGFPTPNDIMVSRTDYALMIEFIIGLTDWIRAAEGCFSAQETFAGALNQFLSGAR
jgi:hypothetical protein